MRLLPARAHVCDHAGPGRVGLLCAPRVETSGGLGTRLTASGVARVRCCQRGWRVDAASPRSASPARHKEVFHSSDLVRRRRAGHGCSTMIPGSLPCLGSSLSHGLITLDRIAPAPLSSDQLPSMPARWEQYEGAVSGCCEERIFAYSRSPVVLRPPAARALR